MLLEKYFQLRQNYPLELASNILNKLNSGLINHVDELHSKNEKIDYWQHPLEAQCFKLSCHTASLVKLLSKSELAYDSKLIEILDVSSVNIIGRAIIENYLTLFHFHFDEIDGHQKEFRFLIYAISALKNRQKFTPLNQENMSQRDRDLIEIGKFTNQLKNNTYFLNLPLKKQKHYLNTKEAIQFKWIELLDDSDLKPELFKDTWKLLSNYAHSEFLSVLQIQDYPESFKNANMRCWSIFELTSMLLSCTISNLSRLFLSAKSYSENMDRELKELVKYFTLIGFKASV